MSFIPERWFFNLRHAYRLEPSTNLDSRGAGVGIGADRPMGQGWAPLMGILRCV
jgi:hypothetical protein